LALSAEKTLIVGCIGPASIAEARVAAAFARDLGALEVRFDALREPADPSVFRGCFDGKTLVATVRSEAEGGAFRGSASEARARLAASLEAGFDLVDVEYRAGENADLMGFPPERVVLSVHDLHGLPPDLAGLAGRMAATGARFVKIAGTANDSSDAIRLLEAQASLSEGNVSLHAMGEAGLATRVLAPYLGSALAYAALVPGRGTAPGQVSAADFLDVYGVGRRRPAARLFVLLGGRSSHSLSPALHNASLEAEGDEALYVPFALRSLVRELPALRDGLSRLGLPLAGASVTIPFKEEAAAFAGAPEPVNTLLFPEDGRIVSASTDRQAFEELIPSAERGERALVLGAGGTARVAAGVLLKKGYDVTFWNRTEQRGREAAARFGAAYLSGDASSLSPRILVNATPLGLDAGDPLPCDVSILRPGLLVFDAPYHEGGTELSRAARASGAEVVDGFALLLAQAAGQAALFTGRRVSAAELAGRLPVRLRRLFDPRAALATGAPR
jgi:3-dehydroquinate dehydratase/shikimate dehydrogenase